MKFAVVLFVFAVAASVSHVNGQDMMNYLMMSRLFNQPETPTSGNAATTGAAGAQTSSAGNPFDLSGMFGGQQRNPIFGLGAMTGTFGDQMQDMTMCSFYPRDMRQLCVMGAFTGSGLFGF